jgi:hypothetical protein
MTSLRTLSLAAIAFLLLAPLPRSGEAHELKVGSIVIKHPWSWQSPMKAGAAAGFMTIINTGSEDDRLVKATSSITGNVQLHDTVMEGDVMNMVELKEGIPIPAGATVVLKPKSLHVMLEDVASLPIAGASFTGTLVFEKAGTIEIDYEVVPLGKEPQH